MLLWQGKSTAVESTDKLNWQSSHVPLSVSVCSNVPGYQEPKCFVSEGEPNQILEEFVKYLTKISTKSSFLLRQQYAAVFEALHQASTPNHDAAENNHENQEENYESEDEEARSIDLMASDNEEEEEEIVSKSEEDRAFVDDETDEQEDMSFYRRLNVELDNERRQEQRQRREEMADYEDMLFEETQTSDNKALYELEENLHSYIQELPVLRFNSGKYELNATKEFLFPYLIETQPIKFTVKKNSNRMCVKTDFLKCLDISNYLAPGFSYDQFLKAYECEQTKGFFPYEWLDCLNKLQETSLPPHAAFYSSLKNANITDEENAYCQQVWEENQMVNLKISWFGTIIWM